MAARRGGREGRKGGRAKFTLSLGTRVFWLGTEGWALFCFFVGQRLNKQGVQNKNREMRACPKSRDKQLEGEYGAECRERNRKKRKEGSGGGEEVKGGKKGGAARQAQ